MRTVNWKALPTGLNIRDAPIQVHWSYFLLLIFNLGIAKLAYDSWNVFWYKLILDGPLLFLIVFTHEFVKAVMTFRLGGEVDRIVLWPLGGLTVHGGNDVRSDLKVVMMGNLSRVPLLILFGGVFLIFKSSVHNESGITLWDAAVYIDELEEGFGVMLVTACRRAFWVTGFLMFLHFMVPIYPMDGLRVWVGVQKAAGMPLQKAAKNAAILGMMISVALMVFGVVEVIRGGWGLSEFALGAFGFVISKMLYQLALNGQLSHDPVLGRSCYEDGNVSSTAPSNDGGGVEVPAAISAPSSAPITTATNTPKETSTASANAAEHDIV